MSYPHWSIAIYAGNGAPITTPTFASEQEARKAFNNPTAFDGVPMSAADTGQRQRARLAAIGLEVRELEQLRDIDTAADARAVAAVNPWTRTAAALQINPKESSAARPVPSDEGALRDGRS